ncbi:hypothetical protein H4Q26_014300 [Puccinia striiformis f. sp. tritici PST-130]|nr:hypothetical protein H4Q26_014300 [Puccinia striiformis f. sp. tritici PST-130]
MQARKSSSSLLNLEHSKKLIRSKSLMNVLQFPIIDKLTDNVFESNSSANSSSSSASASDETSNSFLGLSDF